MQSSFAKRSGVLPDKLHMTDGLAMPVCHFKRAGFSSTFKNIASYGCCASKSETCYGFKGNLVISSEGMITDITVTPANIDDLEAFTPGSEIKVFTKLIKNYRIFFSTKTYRGIMKQSSSIIKLSAWKKVFLISSAISLTFTASATILSSYPLGATTCPMTINTGGGNIVRCIKLTRSRGGSCSTCTITPDRGVKNGQYLLPQDGSTIHYSLEAINTGYQGFVVCAAGCLTNSGLKLSLYSDPDCTILICTTGCGTDAICANTSTLTRCPVTPLVCS